MSADRDETHSESLDVAEQCSSNPIPPGDSPSTQSLSTDSGELGNTPPILKVEGANRDNISGGSVISKAGVKNGQKDSKGQSFTLMRTCSAPPDEHAGISEVGGNGIRTNKIAPLQYSGQPNRMPQGVMGSGDARNIIGHGSQFGLGDAKSEVHRTNYQQRGPNPQPYQQQPQPAIPRGYSVPPPLNTQTPPRPGNAAHLLNDSSGVARLKGANVPSHLSPRVAAPSMQSGAMPQYQYHPQHMQQQQPVHMQHMQQSRSNMMPHMMPQQQPIQYGGQLHPGQMYYAHQQGGYQQQQQPQYQGNGMPGIMPTGNAPRPMYPMTPQQLQQLPPAPPVQSFLIQPQQQTNLMRGPYQPQMQQPMMQNAALQSQYQVPTQPGGYPAAEPKKRAISIKDKSGNIITRDQLKTPGDVTPESVGSILSGTSPSPLVHVQSTSTGQSGPPVHLLPPAATVLPVTNGGAMDGPSAAVSANACERANVSDITAKVEKVDLSSQEVPVSSDAAVKKENLPAVSATSSAENLVRTQSKVATQPTSHDIHSITGSVSISAPEEDDDEKKDQSQSSVTKEEPKTDVAPKASHAVPSKKEIPRGTLIIEAPDDDEEEGQSDASALPSQSATSVSNKSKKTIRKEMLAAADSNREGTSSDMLEAYTIAPKPAVVDTNPDPSETNVKVEVAPKPASPQKPDIDPEDDWETQALKIDDEVPVVSVPVDEEPKPVVRSLRPGGGAKLGVPKPAPAPVVVYRKSELLKIRLPPDQMERPIQCKIYENVVALGPDNQPIPRAQYNARALQVPQYGGPQGDPRYRNSGQYPQQQQHHQHGQNPGGYGDDKQQQGWKRGHQRKGRQPAPPMPRKVISDPVEAMSREVVAILNKITPQTFLKLTRKLAEIEVDSSTMLDKLIRLVVDKAIGEPTFAHLYAEMVSILDAENNYMNFCQVVWNRDSNQYFWIRDMQYSNSLAGPYSSPAECLEVSQGQTLPITQAVNHPVSIDELVVVNGILVNIFKSTDRDEYFVVFMPLSDIDPSLMSEAFFQTKEAAWKSATKKHGFVKMLVKICQSEYMASTEHTGMYAIPGDRRDQLSKKRARMTEDEIALAQFEIEELEGAAKRRMMGNVRFIGELCKKGIIKTNIMHECIRDLLFRDVIDEQMLELVCKLLRTVGQLLEQTATQEQRAAFDSYFAKLFELSRNKKVNSRVRFAMDEIMTLRQDAWQERRATDGPALIEDIRKKAAIEEQMKRQQQQQMMSRGGGRGGRGGGRGGYSVPDSRSPGISRHMSVGPGSSASGSRRGGAPTTPVQHSSHSQNQQLAGADIRRISSEPSPSANPRQYDSPSSSVGSVTPPRNVEVMDPELAARKTKTIMDEYLALKDDKEAFECLAELPESACGELVVNCVDKYLNSNKEDQRKLIVNLLHVVMPQLRAAQSYVESSLAKCEPILVLVDFIVDIKNAPEILGTIVGQLMAGGACRPQALDEVLSDVRKNNSEDEYGYPDEEVVVIHQRFRDMVAETVASLQA